ncbi:mCG148297 [Mus musculus]|nr:mCG148297 [Mus musculus]
MLLSFELLLHGLARATLPALQGQCEANSGWERGLFAVHLYTIAVSCVLPATCSACLNLRRAFCMLVPRKTIKSKTGSGVLLCKVVAGFVSPRLPVCVSRAVSQVRALPSVRKGLSQQTTPMCLLLTPSPHLHLPLLSPSTHADEFINSS